MTNSLLRSADAPQRSINTVTLTWGLVSIPLSVYSGTEDTRVARKEFLNGNPEVSVGRSPIRKDTGAVVDNADVTRMAQATNGEWVALGDDEIADATLPKGLAEVTTFVPLRNINRYLAENVNQVRPKKDKGKVNPAAERAFALLLAAMAERKVAALVSVAMRSAARPALLLPTGDLVLIRTADAIREALPLPTAAPSEAELGMGLSLIDAVGTSTPVLHDTTAEAVQAYVDRKVGGEATPEAPAAPVTSDLMSDLMASIAAAKADREVAS